MEVILLSDVDHVGLRGDVVSVARGYARNYLLPRQLAEEATPARVAEMQKRDAQRARHEAKTADEAREIANTLSNTVLRFDVKAGPTGSLFGSVTPTDIADEIWSHEEDPRRPPQDRDRPDQAHRPLRDPDRPLRGRPRRGQDRGRPRGWRAALRRGARRAGGCRARRAGGGGSGGARRARGDPRRSRRGRGSRGGGSRGGGRDREGEGEVEPEAEVEAEPEWRADADAALTEE